MSDVDFYRTRMGHTYYEHTLPELIRQLTRLNDLLERIVAKTERPQDGRDEPRAEERR